MAGQAFRDGNTSLDEDLRWLGLSCATASATWDHDSWHAIASRQVQFDRSTGALLDLPVALNNLANLDQDDYKKYFRPYLPEWMTGRSGVACAMPSDAS